MADVTALTRATAVAQGEHRRGGEFCSWAAWIKDPTAQVYNAAFYTHGGAETNWEDIELGTNDTYLDLINNLHTCLISYDVSPGWFQLEGGESGASRDVFHKMLEHAAAISYFRTQLGVPNLILPNGAYITRDRKKSLHGGTSSGGYDVLRTQLMPEGTIQVPRDRIVRGDARFARCFDHYCDDLLLSQPQGPLSQFHEYVVSTSGSTTYQADTSGGANVTGATSIKVKSDAVNALYRANRVSWTFASGYLATGTNNIGQGTLNVNTGSAALKRGDFVVFTVASVGYQVQLDSDYVGGVGAIALLGTLPVTVPPGTAISYRQEVALTQDHAAGAGTVTISPSISLTIPDNTAIVLEHPVGEAYGVWSWAQQYLFSKVSGYVWRSDDASGNGFPIDVKRQADVDYMLDLTNQRVYDINAMFIGPAADHLVTSALTGERSFLTRHTPGVVDPTYIDLHSERTSFYLAWWLYTQAQNTNTQLYAGNAASNVNPGDVSVPWNKGRNGSFNPTVFRAYLQARGWV
jgi:hypothetical protein